MESKLLINNGPPETKPYVSARIKGCQSMLYAALSCDQFTHQLAVIVMTASTM